ncbi:hypothetical protein WMY93_009434 [Mugilogobius chulae]|uniref:Uncharacterized protein n=1 Tax=Mugilogobius chulae TaxID=88201 RepID=A0AAW0PEQ2_9GOBI
MIKGYPRRKSNLQRHRGGLGEPRGGVCKSRAMKVIMKVGQVPNANPAAPETPKSDVEDNAIPESSPSPSDHNRIGPVLPANHDHMNQDQSNTPSNSDGILGSKVAVFSAIAAGCIISWSSSCSWSSSSSRCASGPGRTRTRNPAPPRSPSAPCPTPNSRGHGRDRTQRHHHPLRTENNYCPHYEKVSGDYGHPVYIVQEMPRKALPISTTKSDTLYSQLQGEYIEERLVFSDVQEHFFCIQGDVCFAPPAAQIWRDKHWPVTSRGSKSLFV